jgi:hypothetical protein
MIKVTRSFNIFDLLVYCGDHFGIGCRKKKCFICKSKIFEDLNVSFYLKKEFFYLS